MKTSIKLIVLSLILFGFTRQKTLSVTSSAFKDGEMIPAKYTCTGGENSPPLNISNIPAGTKSLALIVHDPDAPKAGGVTHWLAWNLPADGNITENFKGGLQGMNSDHKTGYKGPCPPSGTHHYNFYVYALDTRLHLDSSADKVALENAVRGHVIAQGKLTGLYGK
jgi:Raf kinase inhibitor-like YbhB/YbcL family protein